MDFSYKGSRKILNAIELKCIYLDFHFHEIFLSKVNVATHQMNTKQTLFYIFVFRARRYRFCILKGY